MAYDLANHNASAEAPSHGQHCHGTADRLHGRSPEKVASFDISVNANRREGQNDLHDTDYEQGSSARPAPLVVKTRNKQMFPNPIATPAVAKAVPHEETNIERESLPATITTGLDVCDHPLV